MGARISRELLFSLIGYNITFLERKTPFGRRDPDNRAAAPVLYSEGYRKSQSLRLGLAHSARCQFRILLRQLTRGQPLLQSPQAPGTDTNLSPFLAVANCLLMKIQLPVTLSAIMSMADAMTELRPSTANVTFSGHYFTSRGSITKNNDTTIRQFSQIGKALSFSLAVANLPI